MHENAREKEAHATREHHHTPPPLGCLLARLQHICSFHLFTFFQSLLFSVPCPSHRTLILAEAGQSWDQKREQTERLKTPATQVQALDSTDQVHHFSPKVSVSEERNGDPRYRTCVSSADSPGSESQGALIPPWQTHLRKGIPETRPGNICAEGREHDPHCFSQSLRF